MKATLKEKSLRLLNQKQRELVIAQWAKHQHDDFEADYDISGEKDFLRNFLVMKGVWDPFLASGRYHGRYLFYHNHLFREKTAIEIGCGTGLMGVIMAKCGAKRVIMSDVSARAVENSKKNMSRFCPGKKCSLVQGNLFENIAERADMITWMIPFFPGTPPKGDTISASMLMPPELLEKFLKEAPRYLKKSGVVLLPSFSLGGNLTNPEIIGKKFGYRVKTAWSHNSINGMQRGLLYMHELRK